MAMPCFEVLVLIVSMSISRSVKTFEISTNRPTLLRAVIRISVRYLTSSPAAADCHSAGIRRIRSSSGRLMMFTQSVLWIVMPRPLVTKPTISSPGTGAQHMEKRTARSWTPRTTIPFPDFRTDISGVVFPAAAWAFARW